MAVKVRERGGAWWVFVDHRLPALVEALGDVPRVKTMRRRSGSGTRPT